MISPRQFVAARLARAIGQRSGENSTPMIARNGRSLARMSARPFAGAEVDEGRVLLVEVKRAQDRTEEAHGRWRIAMGIGREPQLGARSVAGGQDPAAAVEPLMGSSHLLGDKASEGMDRSLRRAADGPSNVGRKAGLHPFPPTGQRARCVPTRLTC